MVGWVGKIIHIIGLQVATKSQAGAAVLRGQFDLGL